MERAKNNLIIFAIISLLGIGVIVVVDGIVIPALEAWARGCNNGQAFNASKGRCFGH